MPRAASHRHTPSPPAKIAAQIRTHRPSCTTRSLSRLDRSARYFCAGAAGAGAGVAAGAGSASLAFGAGAAPLGAEPLGAGAAGAELPGAGAATGAGFARRLLVTELRTPTNDR